MAEPAQLLKVSSVAEFSQGTSKVVQTPAGREIAVFREGNHFFAVQNECPHADYPLSEGQLDAGVLQCALHAWTFDLKTGLGIHAPSGVCLERFTIVVRDDVVYVDLNIT